MCISKVFFVNSKLEYTQKGSICDDFKFLHIYYYLSGTEFTMLVDHVNLTYLGGNQTPIVVEWRIFI